MITSGEALAGASSGKEAGYMHAIRNTNDGANQVEIGKLAKDIAVAVGQNQRDMLQAMRDKATGKTDTELATTVSGGKYRTLSGETVTVDPTSQTGAFENTNAIKQQENIMTSMGQTIEADKKKSSKLDRIIAA